MFRKLYLKNFKVWGEQLWETGVELAPLTLVLGTNSSGKTTLLQSLLLLKQTFQSPDPNLDLNLGGQPGDIHDFGMFKDIVHGHTRSNELGFGFTYARGARYEYSANIARGSDGSVLDYRATFASKGGIPVVSSLTMSQAQRRTRDGLQTRQESSVSLRRRAGGAYVVNAATTEYSAGQEPVATSNTTPPHKRYKPEKSLFLAWDSLSQLRGSQHGAQAIPSNLYHAFRKTYYLGPLREYPKRTYLWSRQRPGEIGSRGEQAIAALLASAKSASGLRLQQAGTPEASIVPEVSRWLKAFGVADSLELKRQGQSRYYDVIIRREGRSAGLIDVGFGVSQVLPMIVMAYFVPRGSTIIAEQPEIHLHPLAQSALADLMVEVARERRVQFIVETHSEHMFRRLQSLIADAVVSPDECRLYFAKKDDNGEAALENLRADEFGRIENWPKNFFGDAIGETERQMTRMMERMMSKAKERP
jgi:predicted ATPase